MEKQFIEAIKKVSIYERKEGTSSSYYRASGALILPERLSLSFGTEMVQTARKGRNLMHEVVGQWKKRMIPTQQKRSYPFTFLHNQSSRCKYKLFFS